MRNIIEKMRQQLLARYGYTERYGSPDKLHIIKRVRHYLLSRYGSSATKQKIWDEEFSSGRWDILLDSENDQIYKFINKYRGNGTILDLGCGYGTTLFHNPDGYSKYTGVDISNFAIDKCHIMCKEKQMGTDIADFHISDITSFMPERSYDIILFRESLYYLPKGKIGPVLKKYSEYLSPVGVFIVRIWDTGRFGHILRLVHSSYDVVEAVELQKTSILIFKNRKK
jgi:SAM-dependent methyltransferase